MTGTVWSLIAAAVTVAVLDRLAAGLRVRRVSGYAEATVLALLFAAAVASGASADGARPWLIAALGFAMAAKLAGATGGTRQLDAIDELAGAGAPPGNAASSSRATVAQLDTRSFVGVAELSHPGATQLAGQTYGAAQLTVSYADAAGARLAQAASLVLTLVAMTMYGVAMERHGFDQIGVALGLALVLLSVFALGYRILAGAQATGGRALAILVAAYMATLGSTVVVGIATSSVLIAYGTLTLAASDVVQAGHQFVAQRRWAPAVVAATSQLAQVALLVGLLR